MQLTEVFCYAILTITVTTTIVQAENKPESQSTEHDDSKRISKRETPIMLDYPYENSRREKENVLYRRVHRYPVRQSSPKYSAHRSKYGPPSRSRYRSYNKRGKSKNLNKYPGKYRPKPSYKKTHSKYRYQPKTKPKPYYPGPSKRYPTTAAYSTIPESTGFGEPPVDVRIPLNHMRKPHAEEEEVDDPVVDSYGIPLRHYASSSYSASQAVGIDDPKSPWEDFDNTNAFSKIRPNYAYMDSKPILETGVAHNEDYDENSEQFNLNSYADVYNFGKKIKGRPSKTKAKENGGRLKASGSWKQKKQESKEIVGGQYAEPPGRYVPKFQPSAPMFMGDDDFGPVKAFAPDSDVGGSESVSSYVNYKHSNLAFSPQNLNDAFSIVD